MLEIRENRYFIGIWYLRGLALDWMGVAYKDASEPHYVIHYWVNQQNQSRGFYVPQIESRQRAIEIMTVLVDGMLKTGAFRQSVTKIMINSGKPEKVFKIIRRAAETGKISLTLEQRMG